MNTRAQMPHCDELVLHEPGSCVYCDEFPEKQQERIAKGICFTGQTSLPGLKKPCPSEERRSLETIERWYGNTKRTKDSPSPFDGLEQSCRGCGVPLNYENYRIADGCPCNSRRGVNHGLVAKDTCTCVLCDPEQTGSVRYPVIL